MSHGSKRAEGRGQTQPCRDHALKLSDLLFPQLRHVRKPTKNTQHRAYHEYMIAALADVITLEGKCDLWCHHHAIPGVGTGGERRQRGDRDAQRSNYLSHLQSGKI